MPEPGYCGVPKLEKDWAKRICIRCNERKPMKGGTTYRGARFQCGDCRQKVRARVAIA